MNRPFRSLLLSLAVPLLAHAAVSSAADPDKVLRVAIQADVTGFDPQAMSDIYSNYVMYHVFDPPFDYDYMVRPYKLVPRGMVALPEISPDGKVWTLKVKQGVYFQDDPAFKGNKRELTAHDYIYAWKRLIDPKVRSPYSYFISDRVLGLNEVIAAANKSGKFDYDAEIPGMRAIDRYTIRLELKEPDYVLPHNMTHYSMAAVAREVIEAYGAKENSWTNANPVGTSAFRLKEWKRGSKVVLEANPGYREEYFPETGDPNNPKDAAVMAEMKGKRVPQLGAVEILVLEEDNPRLLAFDGKQIDYTKLPYPTTDRAMRGKGLKPEYVERRISLHTVSEPGLIYSYFNMNDPVVGGYSKEQVALRRAISMGFDNLELIRAVYKGQAMPAVQPVPPNLTGHDPNAKAYSPFNPTAARALLERFGFKDCDGDGFRERPGCQPLEIVQGAATTARDREIAEMWKRSMDKIGIKMSFLTQNWPELLKMAKQGRLQMWQVGWFGSTTDGDTFLGLAYSPNIGKNNYANFKLAEYDELYRKARALPDGPERTKLYRKMGKLIAVFAPWHLNMNRFNNTLVHPWVLGYKQHALNEHQWRYLDLDLAQREAAVAGKQ